MKLLAGMKPVSPMMRLSAGHRSSRRHQHEFATERGLKVFEDALRIGRGNDDETQTGPAGISGGGSAVISS